MNSRTRNTAKNTWIVCVSSSEGKIYHSKSFDEGVQCIKSMYGAQNPSGKTNLRHLKKLFRFVADEMDYACGSGTTGRLIVTGDPRVVNHFCNYLSDEVRARIIGIVPRNLCSASPEGIHDATRDFLGGSV
jgi:hypothetical protein